MEKMNKYTIYYRNMSITEVEGINGEEALKNFVLDLVFPMKCIYCSLEGDWLCNKCLDLVKRDNYNLCPICEVENSNGAVCGFCRKNSNLDGLMVVLENSQLNQKIIHLVKYNFITELLNYIKPKIFSCINNNPNWRDYFVLVPPWHLQLVLCPNLEHLKHFF